MPTLTERRIDRAAILAVQKRLAAKLHQQQIATLGVSEKLAAEIDTAINRVLRDIQRGLSVDQGAADNFRRLQKLAGPLWPAIAKVLAERLPVVARWSHKANADLILGNVPRDMWRAAQPNLVIPGTARAAGMGGVPRTPVSATAAGGGGPEDRLRADILHEPVLRKGSQLTDDEWLALAKDIIIPPPSRERVNDWVYAPTQESTPDGLRKIGTSQNWEQRLARWSKRIADPDRLAATLARGISDGKNVQELTKELRSEFDLARSTAKRIARTEARRVAMLAQHESFRSLGDLMAGMQINAQMDQNTRPHHAARNGVIYWNDDRRTPHISQMPDIPDEPHCRCWTAPVLVEPDDLRGNPGLADELMNAGKDAIPDASAYDRWFASAEPGARRQAVGKRLYDTVAARLDKTGQRPEWADFLNRDGQLLTKREAEKETPAQRAERKRDVEFMLRQREQQFRQVAATGFAR